MAGISWEHAAEVRQALHVIVADPDYGAAALSSTRTMTNLLNDLPRPGQDLECYTGGGDPVIVWTMPTQDVVFLAEYQVSSAPMTDLIDWADDDELRLTEQGRQRLAGQFVTDLQLRYHCVTVRQCERVTWPGSSG